ncbi:hypothetical protein GCM10023324_43070 [Streptomyces youssoufiensis]
MRRARRPTGSPVVARRAPARTRRRAHATPLRPTPTAHPKAGRRAPGGVRRLGSGAVLRRSSLLWLLAPYVLYLGALPLVNRVHPTVFGLPFLLFWMVVATVLTPVAVWLAWRGDRRRGRV